jgi:hypothetical protein
MKYQFITTAIVILFLGVAVAPTINCSVVTASEDDDFIKVTTQACGIQGYGDTTVKLTREQYNDLEEYLVEFRARLNQTSSREEAVPIFKDAVVELDKYGLLPSGMSVERVQKLVTERFLNERLIKIAERFSKKILGDRNEFINNSFCLIAGYMMSGQTISIFTFFSLIPLIIAEALAIIFEYTYPTPFLNMFYRFAWTNFFYGFFLKPVNLMSILLIGALGAAPFPGIIYSFNLLGIKRIEGLLSGVGWGFTGIRIVPDISYPNYATCFFLGTVFQLNIHVWDPWSHAVPIQ